MTSRQHENLPEVINLETTKPTQEICALDISNDVRITYSWKGINVWAKNSEANNSKADDLHLRHIIKNANGVVRPGELLAILGASGAGKSTLLDALTLRQNKEFRMEGERCVNGVVVDQNRIASLSAYIQQNVIMLEKLTVREHLVCQALLRMPSTFSNAERMQRVDEIILQFHLLKCADTRIGFPGNSNGISGGELRRLEIASEVLSGPQLLFCDEPTSGLDSHMSQSVVSILKSLASQGKTILCSIHQPSSQVFEMFNKILLLSEGRVVFMGDTAGANGFFKQNGYYCPEKYSPADFYIKTLAIETGNEGICRERVNVLCNFFEKFNMEQNLENEEKFTDVVLDKQFKISKSPWLVQFRVLLWRNWLCNLRDPMFVRVKLLQMTIMAFTVGVIFFGQATSSDEIENTNHALFNVMMNLSFGSAAAACHVFCSEQALFQREFLNGLYRADVYFLSKTLAEFPFYILAPFLATFIIYFMIGLRFEVAAFFLTVGIYILVANCAVSIGYLISCLVKSVSVAATMVPPAILPFVLLGGLFLKAGSIPDYLLWLKYLSWFHYGNEALTIIHWSDFEGGECAMANSTCFTSGQTLLDSLNLNRDNLQLDILAIVGLTFVFRMFAFIALLWKSFN